MPLIQMSKPLALSIVACAVLAGCQIFQPSPTWKKVVNLRVPLPRDGDASKIYAAALDRELTASGVEHKVVTYQYHYRSRVSDDATAEYTAVIYRDGANPKYPWWLKDERHGRPLWLPNGSIEQQIEFYVGRDVEITGGGDGKAVAVGELEPILRRITRSLRLSAPRPRETPPPVAESLKLPSFYEAFRNIHGTEYDATSPVDRKKMEEILRTPQI